VNRGIDPRDFALLPFGGAGPMHAAELAAELGITRMICPRAGGVLSALGLIASPRRRDFARTVMLRGAGLTAEAIEREVQSLRGEITEAAGDFRETVSYELRYVGQSFELAVEDEVPASPETLANAFATEHERRYGFTVEGAPIELVAIRIAVEGASPEVGLPRGEGAWTEGARSVRFVDGWHDAFVGRGEPVPGLTCSGPAVLHLPESTMVLPPGWSAEVDEHGSVVAEAGG
jgi:N-methylhydantoinase A